MTLLFIPLILALHWGVLPPKNQQKENQNNVISHIYIKDMSIIFLSYYPNISL